MLRRDVVADFVVACVVAHRPIIDRTAVRLPSVGLSTDADEHENGGTLIRSKGHMALIHEGDHAPWIERVGVDNLLVLLATRAAAKLITGPCDDLDGRCLSAGSGAGWARRTGRTRGSGRTGFALGRRFALSTGGQDEGH